MKKLGKFKQPLDSANSKFSPPIGLYITTPYFKIFRKKLVFLLTILIWGIQFIPSFAEVIPVNLANKPSKFVVSKDMVHEGLRKDLFGVDSRNFSNGVFGVQKHQSFEKGGAKGYSGLVKVILPGQEQRPNETDYRAYKYQYDANIDDFLLSLVIGVLLAIIIVTIGYRGYSLAYSRYEDAKREEGFRKQEELAKKNLRFSEEIVKHHIALHGREPHD